MSSVFVFLLFLCGAIVVGEVGIEIVSLIDRLETRPKDEQIPTESERQFYTAFKPMKAYYGKGQEPDGEETELQVIKRLMNQQDKLAAHVQHLKNSFARAQKKYPHLTPERIHLLKSIK